MLLYNDEYGFSLIEIIVAIAILGIIVVSIMGLLGNSIVHVFSSGKKDKAVSRAANQMELLYSINPKNKAELILNNAELVTDSSQQGGLYDETDKNIIRYCIEGETEGFADGFKVTIVAFYMNGKRYVTLTSFIRKREG
jgi:prepilin-type N-terminal cleavage/methylation domain-containing protein